MKNEQDLTPLQKARIKRREMQESGTLHPDVVTICGKSHELKKLPVYRRAYFERLAKVGTAPSVAIRLKCYECSGYSTAEAKRCRDRDCALFVLRHNREKQKQAPK